MPRDKRCGKCGEFKPEKKFYLLDGRYRSSYCKKCDNQRRRPKIESVNRDQGITHVDFNR